MVSIFGNYDRHGQVAAVGKAEVHISHAHGRCALQSAAAQVQCGPLAGLALYLNLPPTDAAADSGAEGFGRCFFRSKAGGEALPGTFLAQAICDLAGGKDSLREPLAKPVEALLHTGYLDQIRS